MGAGADDAFAAWDAGDANVEEAAEEQAKRAANDEEGFHWLSIGLLDCGRWRLPTLKRCGHRSLVERALLRRWRGRSVLRSFGRMRCGLKEK